jgi:hypothetical protein
LSVAFLLWFLGNLIRESRAQYRRHAHRPVCEVDTWPVRTFSPQAPSSSVLVPHNAGKSALRPLPQFAPEPAPKFAPQFGQSSRSLHSVSR